VPYCQNTLLWTAFSVILPTGWLELSVACIKIQLVRVMCSIMITGFAVCK